MKTYLVGGSVRDKLLGLTPKDNDFVVVGCSPQDMLDKGFTMVGKDFPVFIHSVSGDEYALARKERKIGEGYYGFECEWEGVTLEEDLSRRDLTINAMAQEVVVDGNGKFEVVGGLVDPFGGVLDLTNKYLRPTTNSFSEDPLRILRVARFLARYKDFQVTPSLLEACKRVYISGELEYLTPERVWLEMEKALKESYPERFFEFLVDFDFPLMKHFRDMITTVENNQYHMESDVFCHTMMVLKHAAENWKDSEINFSAIMHDIAKPKCYKEKGNAHSHDREGVSLVEGFCKQWKVSNNYRDLSKIVCEQHQRIHTVMGRDENNWSKPKSIMSILEDSGALRNPERFKKVLKACESDAKGRIGLSAKDYYYQREYLEDCLDAVISLDTKEISSKLIENGKCGKVIGLEIRAARINEIRKVQKLWKEKMK